MLQKAVQPRTGEFDYLVVELERALTKGQRRRPRADSKYAIAVASDERFQGVKAKWTFIAISNELDDFAKRTANQRGQPKGKVFDDAELNITVWAKCWAEVLSDAQSRLRFSRTIGVRS